jgi:hypothetical protein
VKRADELIPWKVTDISLRPFKGMWSMNPSIHYDGDLWRCVLRCTDYAMPGGVTVRSDRARPGESRTKNAMVILDPERWTPVELYKMRERDDLPRATVGSVGYEDVRLFRTDREGLQGIAASLHLRRSGRGEQLAEQVILSFDEQYDIVDAQPIRGGSWSVTAQKNWAPFDHCEEPRFLYAIDKGILFDDRGELRASDAAVRPSSRPRRIYAPDDDARERAAERAREVDDARERDVRRRDRRGDRPVSALPPTEAQTPSCEGLRGGSQLVRVGDDAWLGIGHAMRFVDKLKYYWHVWYLVDSRGRTTSASPPMKLVPNGIEFAAGIAVDVDRLVVSFGVDDMECRLAETKLSAVMEILRPVQRSVTAGR